jgi:hypothetical protein
MDAQELLELIEVIEKFVIDVKSFGRAISIKVAVLEKRIEELEKQNGKSN